MVRNIDFIFSVNNVGFSVCSRSIASCFSSYMSAAMTTAASKAAPSTPASLTSCASIAAAVSAAATNSSSSPCLYEVLLVRGLVL